MKTIAQQLNIQEFPFEIKDKNNNLIYRENSNGFWIKREFNKNNNLIYRENSDGYWFKKEFDQNNNEIYCEYSDGSWVKQEFDENNNEIYFEDSDGNVEDKRPKKEISMDEIAAKFGIPVDQLKIKK